MTKKYLPALLLTGISFLATWQAFASPRHLIAGGDVISYWIPIRQAAAADAGDHPFPPLWNSKMLSGNPRIGNPNTGGPYPFHVLCLLPDVWMVNLWVILHLLLGAFGMRYWARVYDADDRFTLAAAVIYIMATVWPARILSGHLTILPALAWAPILLGALERVLREQKICAGIALTVAASMLILGAHLQMVFYVVLLCVALTLGHLSVRPQTVPRSMGWLALAAVGVLLLTAVHWMPMREILPETYRASESQPIDRSNIVMRGADWARWFAPLPHLDGPGSHQLRQEKTYSIGITATLLMLLGIVIARRGKRTWFLVAIGLGAILLSLGEKAPLDPLASQWLPFYGQFRAVPRCLILLCFVAPLLAAYGVKALLETMPRVRLWMILGVVVIEGLIWSSLWITPQKPPREYAAAPPREGRLYDPVTVPFNLPAFNGYETVTSYDPMVLRRYLEYYHEIWETMILHRGSTFPHSVSQIKRRELFDLLSTKYVVTHETVPLKGFTRIREVPGVGFLYRNEQALPRAFTVPEATTRKGPHDPRAVVVLPEESRTVSHEGRFQNVHIKRKEAGLLHLETESPHPRYLVVSEIYSAGWKATVDGKPAPILPAWHALMCISLEAGKHEVRLEFSPSSFRVGFWISLVAWILLLVGLSLSRVRGLKIRANGAPPSGRRVQPGEFFAQGESSGRRVKRPSGS